MKQSVMFFIMLLALSVSCNNITDLDVAADFNTTVGSYLEIDVQELIHDSVEFNAEMCNWRRSDNNPSPSRINNIYNKPNNYVAGFNTSGMYKFYYADGITDKVYVTISINVEQNHTSTFFKDPTIESQIRYILKQPSGQILEKDLLEIDEFNLSMYNFGVSHFLDGLEKLPNLTHFSAHSHDFSSIQPLSGLIKLKHLSLQNCKELKNIEAISNLTNLEHLDLDSCPIEDVSPVGSCSNLSFLNLSFINENITGIEKLQKCIKLKHLYFAQATLNDIQFIAELENLEHLLLGLCNITKIEPIRSCQGLNVLYLNNNNISDLEPIRNLNKLAKLYIGSNNISDITPLSSLESIFFIEMEKNNISDLGPLLQNTNIDSGDLINVSENPLNSYSINTVIPELEKRGVIVIK